MQTKLKTITDTAKTNVRLSKNMKEKLIEHGNGADLVTVSRVLIRNFIKEYNEKGIEYTVLEMLKYKTYRKIALDDSDKDNTAKDYMLCVVLDKNEFLYAKKICDEIGISFAECVRRLINRAIENDTNIK